jgi:hypothetical protein
LRETNETKREQVAEERKAREREKIATQNTRGKKTGLGFRVEKREKREKMYKSSTVKKRLETR